MESFFCTNCRFRFKAERPKTCPYCSKANGIEKERSASELVDEVEDLLQN